MKRRHLFEFGDQKWVPPLFKKYLHELLQYQVSKFYSPILPTLMSWLIENKIQEVTDLASGAGGPWIDFISRVRKEVPSFEVKLSDLRPSTSKIPYYPSSVDLRDPTSWPEGALTVFTGFHHLKPDEALNFIRTTSFHDKPIFVAEFTERKFSKVLGMILAPLIVFVDTLNIKPLSVLRLLFTYFVPVIPLIYSWDGAVSHLRTHTMEELQKMFRTLELDQNSYSFFEVKNTRHGMNLSGFFTIPKHKS